MIKTIHNMGGKCFRFVVRDMFYDILAHDKAMTYWYNVVIPLKSGVLSFLSMFNKIIPWHGGKKNRYSASRCGISVVYNWKNALFCP